MPGRRVLDFFRTARFTSHRHHDADGRGPSSTTAEAETPDTIETSSVRSGKKPSFLTTKENNRPTHSKRVDSSCLSPSTIPPVGQDMQNSVSRVPSSTFGERFFRGVGFTKRSMRHRMKKGDSLHHAKPPHSTMKPSVASVEDDSLGGTSNGILSHESRFCVSPKQACHDSVYLASAFGNVVAQAPPTPRPRRESLQRGFFHSFTYRSRDSRKIADDSSKFGLSSSASLSPVKTSHRSPMIGPQKRHHLGRHTLVLDLDETLVHSSFVKIPNYSFIIPVEIEGHIHSIYVAKRPGVDVFLRSVSRRYEIVVFTASLAKYADPLLDALDPQGFCAWRLFRESCVLWNGQFVKDLSKLGRDLKKVIILDNSPASYAFQPENAIPIETWIDDVDDSELFELIPLLEALTHVDDVPAVLWKTQQAG